MLPVASIACKTGLALEGQFSHELSSWQSRCGQSSARESAPTDAACRPAMRRGVEGGRLPKPSRCNARLQHRACAKPTSTITTLGHKTRSIHPARSAGRWWPMRIVTTCRPMAGSCSTAAQRPAYPGSLTRFSTAHRCTWCAPAMPRAVRRFQRR